MKAVEVQIEATVNEEFEVAMGNHFERLGFLHTDLTDFVGCKQVQGQFDETVSEAFEAVADEHVEMFGHFHTDQLDLVGQMKTQEQAVVPVN